MKQILAVFLSINLLFFSRIGLLRADDIQAKDDKQPTIDDLDIEDLLHAQIVSTASKYSQDSLKAPSSTSVINKDQIQKFGYRTLSELIRGVRSFYTTYDYNYNYTGVRGFGRPSDYDTRILVLLNGHRLNDSIYSSATTGTDFILDIDLVEKVEIVRGPSSSIYGSNAFFAVINIFTRDHTSLKGFEVSADAAKDNTYQGRASFAKKFSDDFSMLVSATGFDSDGSNSLYFKEYDDLATNNGVAKGLDSTNGRSFFGQFNLGDFKLDTGFIHRDKQIPTASYGTIFNSPLASNVDDRYYADLQYTNQLNKENLLDTRVYYDLYKFRGFFPYENAEDPATPIINNDYSEGQKVGFIAQNTNTSIKDNTFILGTEVRSDFIQKQYNFDSNADGVLNLDSKRNEDIWSLFLQNEYQFNKWVGLNAGLRYDNYQTVKDQLNPRFGLIITPEKDSAVKLLYGTAFRAPNAFELFYSQDRTQKAPIGLNSEEITTYELIYEKYFSTNIRSSFSVYEYQLDGLIDQTVDPVDNLTVYNNRPNISAKGFEAELEYKFSGGWLIRKSYGLQETLDNSQSSGTLSNSPKNILKSHLVVPVIHEKLFAALETIYISNRLTLANNNTSDYCLMNFTISTKNIFDNLDISTSLYNLLDKKYSDPGSTEHRQDLIPQQGISWRLQTTYRF